MPNIGTNSPSGVSGLPTGGVSGQYLAKQSAANFDTKWTSVVPVPSGLLSGQWYDNRFLGGAVSTTMTMNSGSTYYVPLYVPSNISVSAIAVYNVASNSPTYTTLGWSTSSSGLPGTLLWTGALTSAAVGIQPVATNNFSVPRGWHFICVYNAAGVGASTQFLGVSARSTQNPLGANLQPSSAANSYYTVTGVPVSNATGNWTGNSLAPGVWYKVA